MEPPKFVESDVGKLVLNNSQRCIQGQRRGILRWQLRVQSQTPNAFCFWPAMLSGTK